MSNANRIGGLTVLAMGLSIAAAVTAWPGTAVADGGSLQPDPWIAADAVSLLSSDPPTPTDIDVSIDGIDVFNGHGTASASSGMGDIAIAIGPHADAIAKGGYGDFASADSTGSNGAYVVAGDDATGATGNNFDFASAVGNNASATAGDTNGSPDITGSSFDFANTVGNNASAQSGMNGSNDIANILGNNAFASAGDSNNAAAPADFDSASILTNLFASTTNTSDAWAGGLGSSGAHDLAFVFDPFGTVGSDATAGLGHNFDLAGALGDELNSLSAGSDFVFHIAPLF